MAMSRIVKIGCLLAGAHACKTPGQDDCAQCVNEIQSAADYHAIKDSIDLVLDVRTYFEYIGTKDDSEPQCSSTTNSALASMPEQKCQMGHVPSMWHAVNPDRADKAVMYKVDGKYTLDLKIIKELQECYGAHAANMKIAISCYSGYRSRIFQTAMKVAGFKCGNIYNVGPGAQGLWSYNSSVFVKGYESKGPWSCAKVPPPAAAGSSTGASAPSTGTSTGTSAPADDHGGSGDFFLPDMSSLTGSSTPAPHNDNSSTAAAAAATGASTASTEASTSNANAVRTGATLAAMLCLWMQN